MSFLTCLSNLKSVPSVACRRDDRHVLGGSSVVATTRRGEAHKIVAPHRKVSQKKPLFQGTVSSVHDSPNTWRNIGDWYLSALSRNFSAEPQPEAENRGNDSDRRLRAGVVRQGLAGGFEETRASSIACRPDRRRGMPEKRVLDRRSSGDSGMAPVNGAG